MLSACAVASPCCYSTGTPTDIMPTKPTREWKLCLIGDPGVGKTSIGIRFKHNRFNERQISTVGAAFFTMDVEVDNEVHRINTWDTAGQEQYRSLAPLYYRNANAVVLAYSINKYETFKHVMDVWLRSAQMHTDDDVVLAIVGNKLDMSSSAQDLREVPTKEASDFAGAIDAIFMETSAKTGENIDKLFKDIGRKLQILNNTRRHYSTASSSDSERDLECVSHERKHHFACCR